MLHDSELSIQNFVEFVFNHYLCKFTSYQLKSTTSEDFSPFH